MFIIKYVLTLFTVKRQFTWFGYMHCRIKNKKIKTQNVLDKHNQSCTYIYSLNGGSFQCNKRHIWPSTVLNVPRAHSSHIPATQVTSLLATQTHTHTRKIISATAGQRNVCTCGSSTEHPSPQSPHEQHLAVFQMRSPALQRSALQGDLRVGFEGHSISQTGRISREDDGRIIWSVLQAELESI